MTADRDPLERLAESVSDGGAVDWDAVESDGGGADVKAMHDVSRIAAFHRDLQRASEAGTTEPPQAWGPLLMLEQVGAGANGEVWRAWDPALQREVALKLLALRATEAGPPGTLLDEARALARVRHPDVVTVYGVAEHDGRAGMWMEFLRGPTLAAEIERRGAFDALEVARLGARLARALAAVHAAGLVHRDLKPANVVLEGDDRVVLADFGLGRLRALAGTDPLRVSGTPMFMAPERLQGGAATPRTDLYALGVTLRCALAGQLPFAAGTVGELLVEARKGPAVPLARECPAAPAPLVAAIERAMAPDPEQRFGGAEALAAALEAAAKPRGARARTALLAAAIVLVAGAAWLLPHLARRVPEETVTAPAPAAPVQPVAYDVEATFIRHSDDGTERLANGDRVAPGDRLTLEFHATRRAWVYVLNEDERGAAFLLFPQQSFDLANPLPADSAITLPGPVAGEENAWTVTSRGGREHMLVVASPAPVPEIEAELQRLPHARPGVPIQYASVPAPTIERLRGVGGVAPLPGDDAPKRAGLFDRFEDLAGRETGVHGTWVRQVTLDNPLR